MEDRIKILVAEDDPNLGNVLKTYLEAKGYNADLVTDGLQAVDKFKTDEYNFFILDVMMPFMDGFSVAAQIRNTMPNVPIIFLTAKALREDILKGFELGADDYLTKPFEMEELFMRIKAICKRTPLEALNLIKEFEIGNFHFEPEKRMIELDGEPKKLTTKENELLRVLAQNQERLVDRGIALRKVWGDDSYFNGRSMDVYITKLRKILKEDPTVEIINIHGKGFKLVVNED
jgi:two-component system, OmpR family, response regulator